jgi:hypothetical protein
MMARAKIKRSKRSQGVNIIFSKVLRLRFTYYSKEFTELSCLGCELTAMARHAYLGFVGCK